jgi:hypothetical protein
MSRKLKRVPLDFDWPPKERWSGYLNPHYVKCPACDGQGVTKAAQALDRLVGLIMLAGENSLRGYLHPWLNNIGLPVPSPDFAELTTGLAGRKMSPLGHDAIDRLTAVEKIMKAAELKKSWGTCLPCKGDGCHIDHQEAYKTWEPTEPPKGEGYQLWENVSEGSAVSPVFASLDELCVWCEGNATTFAHFKATAAEWKKMLEADFVHAKEGSNIFL